MQNIKFKYIEIILLIGIILLGTFLFLFRLSSNPPGLYIDEAGSAYNSYSILKTGKDEYGKQFPMAFKLFGSYTPPLFIYLNVPIIGLLGLNVFSARFLSVICGIALIVIYFLLVKELKIYKSKFTILISTLFFAITPWLIFYSRIGYEQNLALLFFAASLLLLLKSLKNNKLLIFCLPLISLATYTDYSQKIIGPLLLLGFLILFIKNLLNKKNYKQIVIGFIVALLIQIPNIFMAFTPSFYTKSNYFLSNISSGQIEKVQKYLPLNISVVLTFTRDFLAKFVTYLSPRSLFFLPDPDPQRSIPNLSTFYPWMIIPYLVGLYLLFKNKKNSFSKIIILLLLITPIPGALTGDPFHIQRTFSLLVPISLIMTIGIDKLIYNKQIKMLLPITLFLLIISLIIFGRAYFRFLPLEKKYVWGFQYPILAEYITNHPNDIFVIDQTKRVKPQDISYIQLAFYLKIQPEKIQNDQNKDIVKNYYYDKEFSYVHQLDNLEFRPIEWGESVYRDVIFVGDQVSISDDEVKLHNLTQVFEIRDSNGQIVLRGFKSNPVQKR